MTQGAADILQTIQDKNVIVFDGECVLCSRFFNFVLKRDNDKAFHFLTAQSEAGEALYAHFGLKAEDYDTNLVLIEGRLYERLAGFFQVMKIIGWPWRALTVGSVLPSTLLDWLYYGIARNRYALFGKRETCLVPTPDIRERFLG